MSDETKRKKRTKEKKEFSTVSNILFSAREAFTANPLLPILWILLYAIGLAMKVATTYQSKLILDALGGRNDVPQAMLMIGVVIGAFLAITLVNAGVDQLCGYLNNLMWNTQCRRRAETLCRADYDKMESAEYKDRFSQYADFKHSVPWEFDAFLNFAQAILSAIIFGTLVSTLHPLILVGLVVLAVLHYLAKRFLVNRQHEYEKALQANDRRFRYVTNISGDFENAKEVRLYHLAPWLDSVTDDCLATHRRYHSKIQWGAFRTGAIHNFLSLIRDSFAYIYLIILFTKGEMTPGDFVLFFTAITTLSSTITGLTEKVNNIHEYDLKITEARKTERIASDRNHGRGCPIPVAAPKIEFRNVSFRYPLADHDTLKHLSFTIEKGERLALVGVNGAGKTTLVKLLCGLYLPTEGEILVDGHPVSDYNIDEYYSLFSAVFQDISIMPFSIAENVAATLEIEKIDRDRVERCLHEAGLSEKLKTLEKGIDTLFNKEVNEGAIDLSGGEKQKLALARAIYLARPILVLDEPTAALDPIAESEMYERFDSISCKATSLYISHRLASTRFCDRILHIENGEIIEEGDHKSLLEANGKYAEMFRVQSAYYREEATKDEA